MAFIPMLTPYQSAFESARDRLDPGSGFVCKIGLWPDAAAPRSLVFKLQKPHWSGDRSDAIGDTCGLFFSAWTDEDPRHPNRLRYNIHALKLRSLPGYKLESRKFAEAFRAAFTPMKAGWPNVSLDYGPQTLMEGFLEVTPESCADALVDLASRFVPVAGLIEDLLVKAKG